MKDIFPKNIKLRIGNWILYTDGTYAHRHQFHLTKDNKIHKTVTRCYKVIDNKCVQCSLQLPQTQICKKSFVSKDGVRIYFPEVLVMEGKIYKLPPTHDRLPDERCKLEVPDNFNKKINRKS